MRVFPSIIVTILKCGREINRDDIVQIQETVATFGGLPKTVVTDEVFI
jgi:hypothetical protein